MLGPSSACVDLSCTLQHTSPAHEHHQGHSKGLICHELDILTTYMLKPCVQSWLLKVTAAAHLPSFLVVCADCLPALLQALDLSLQTAAPGHKATVNH